MEFKIRKTDWYKRRVPVKEIEPEEVTEITGFELKDNHRCIMYVRYSDGVVYELTGRVYENTQVRGKWAVQGINAHGKMVIVDILEEISDFIEFKKIEVPTGNIFDIKVVSWKDHV